MSLYLLFENLRDNLRLLLEIVILAFIYYIIPG